MAGSKKMPVPNSEDRRPRRLLAKPLGSTLTTLPPASGTKFPVRRSLTKAACEQCRKRKSKCTGERPSCNICRKRSIKCQYVTASSETHSQALRRKYDELLEERKQMSPHEQLISLLRSLPERESLDIVRRLSAGHSVEEILSHVSDGNLLLQLHLVPETRLRYELPQFSNHEEQEVNSRIYPSKLVKYSAIEVLGLLKSLPDCQAHQLLIDLRTKEGQDTAHSLEPNPALCDLPPHPGSPAQEVFIMSRSFEDELAEGYPIAYPKFPPISITALKMSDLLKPRASKLWRSAENAAEEEKCQPTQTGHSAGNYEKGHGPRSEPLARDLHLLADGMQQTTSVEDFYDRRLGDLDISRWTHVPISNAFAARVITLYLKTDHPLLGLFDPYLFIDDLVNGGNSYCSSFLVDTLMFFGCQMYIALDNEASQHVNAFLRETEGRYVAERDNDSSLNMAALVLRSLSLMCQARDHAVVQSAKDAMRMGVRLGFFKGGKPPLTDPEELLDNKARMDAYVTWGAFCWDVIITLFYRQPQVEVTSLSPTLPIPKNCLLLTTHNGPEGAGDMMGEVFPSLCQFWLIVHEGIWIYYRSHPEAPSDVWRPILAEHKFRELIAWANRVPLSLHRAKTSGPHVPVCHIWLHAALMNIVRTFVGTGSQATKPWGSFTASDSSGDAAYKASVNQLKRLILDYRTNYEASTYSILWHTGLLYLVNALLESPRDPEWHLYFLLCIYGYQSLRGPYHITESIGKSLLAMALRDTDLPVAEAREILKQLQSGELAEVRNTHSATFMADLKLANIDPISAQVENMAEEFETMALFNEIMERNHMDFPE